MFFLETSLGVGLMAKTKCRGGQETPLSGFHVNIQYVLYVDIHCVQSSDFLRNVAAVSLPYISVLLDLMNGASL